MSDERKTDRGGVKEARLGLTLLTCLLVALGYYVLQRLGVETEPQSSIPLRGTATNTRTGPPGVDAESLTLPIQEIEPAPIAYPQTALRPVWLAPQQDSEPRPNDTRRNSDESIRY